MTLAGLPLTAGFASEWLTLEALMQQFRIDDCLLQLLDGAAGAWSRYPSGSPRCTFVRMVGLTVLGPRGPADTGRGRDVGPSGHRVGMLGGRAASGWPRSPRSWIRVLAAGLDPVVGAGCDRRCAEIGNGFCSRSTPSSPRCPRPGSSIVMPLLLLAVIAGMSVALRARPDVARYARVPAWSSATGGVDRGVGYTPFGFANPVRKVLANLLLTRSELTILERETGGRTDDPHRNAAGAHLGYTSDVVEVVERFLFRPLRGPLMLAVRTAKRMQNGRLAAYLGYMLIALIAVLAVVAGLA